jgi:hypothetical protein
MRSRNWLVGALMALVVVFADNQARAEEGLTLTAAHFGGGLDMSSDWTARVVGSVLTVERPPGKMLPARKLVPDALLAIEQALDHSGFEGLREKYGCSSCNDVAVCRLVVTIHGTSHEVKVFSHSLQGSVPNAEEADEIKRFVSVWRTLKKQIGLGDSKDLCF